MLYRQVTAAERYTLGLLRQQGLCPAAIARTLGRHRSTIGRELQRNRAHNDGTYRPQLADWYARGRRSRSRRNRQFSSAEWSQVQELLRERGTNENTNGLVRQYLPKRQGMAHLTQHDCNRIAAKLNRRPRKRLGYRTPEECYAG